MWGHGFGGFSSWLWLHGLGLKGGRASWREGGRRRAGQLRQRRSKEEREGVGGNSPFQGTPRGHLLHQGLPSSDPPKWQSVGARVPQGCCVLGAALQGRLHLQKAEPPKEVWPAGTPGGHTGRAVHLLLSPRQHCPGSGGRSWGSWCVQLADFKTGAGKGKAVVKVAAPGHGLGRSVWPQLDPTAQLRLNTTF